MVVEVAKTQDEEVGDGTTTAVILAGELLKKSEDLIEQNVHPSIIAGGYRMAADKSIEVLSRVAKKIDIKDEKLLREIAATAMISKSIGSHRDMLAKIAVNSVTMIAEKTEDGSWSIDEDNIQITKKQGAGIADSELIPGVIIDKERVHPGMPRNVKKAKIALLDSAIEVKKTEIDAKIEITDPAQLQAFLKEEENMLSDMVAMVKKSGANVLFCQKGIDDLAQHYLAKEGIYTIRRVKKSDMEKLAKATGATVVSKIDELRKGQAKSTRTR
jgi:chaperonin GroEL (HSP60 family)